MFCPKCGRENPDKASFCAACGNPVKKIEENPEPKKQKNSAAIIIAVVAVILAVAVIAVGVMMAFKNGGSGSDITAVTNPDFELSDGFIKEVETKAKTPDGYIAIDNADDFSRIGSNPSAEYILTADIDLSDTDFDSIKDFYGVIDGNGYTVSGLSCALILDAENAEIMNLGIECDIEGISAALAVNFSDGSVDNCFVKGSVDNNGNAAGLIHNCESSSITNCYSSADVTGGSNYVGGLGSVWSDCTVENCCNSGDVTNLGEASSNYVGGIAACFSGGSIIGCYNSGDLTCTIGDRNYANTEYGNYIACGIVGEAEPDKDETLKIAYCYNSGSLSGDIAFGITAAWTTIAERVTVTDCYNSGDFMTANSYGIAGCLYGGLGSVTSVKIRNCVNVTDTGRAAISNNSTDIVNCYYLDSHESVIASDALFADVYSLSKTEMAKKKSFSLDFDTVWQMGDDHPVFGYETIDEVK